MAGKKNRVTNTDIPPTSDIDALARFFDENDTAELDWKEVKDFEAVGEPGEVRIDIRLPQKNVDRLKSKLNRQA